MNGSQSLQYKRTQKDGIYNLWSTSERHVFLLLLLLLLLLNINKEYNNV